MQGFHFVALVAQLRNEHFGLFHCLKLGRKLVLQVLVGVLQVFMPLEQGGVASLLVDELLSFCLHFLVETLGLFEVESKLRFEFDYATFVLGNSIDFGHEIAIVFED